MSSCPRMQSGDVRRAVQRVLPVLRPVLPVPPRDGRVRLSGRIRRARLRPGFVSTPPMTFTPRRSRRSRRLRVSVCPAGYYGRRCSEVCVSCANNSTCDHRDGHCECLPGWTATDCSKGDVIKRQSRRRPAAQVTAVAASVCFQLVARDVSARSAPRPAPVATTSRATDSPATACVEAEARTVNSVPAHEVTRGTRRRTRSLTCALPSTEAPELSGSVMVPLPPGGRESWGAIGGIVVLVVLVVLLLTLLLLYRRRQKDKQSHHAPTVSFSAGRTVNSEYAVPGETQVEEKCSTNTWRGARHI